MLTRDMYENHSPFQLKYPHPLPNVALSYAKHVNFYAAISVRKKKKIASN